MWKHAWRNKDKLYVKSLLCLAGDVELNPGPNYKYPCPRCNKPVKSNQKGIQCDTCNNWFHANCEYLSSSVYSSLSVSVDPWYCSVCSLPPLSDSFFGSSEVDTSLSSADSSAGSSSCLSGCEGQFPRQEFCVFQANVRSLYRSLDDLCSITRDAKPDILVLCETWLDDTITDHEVNIMDYHLLRKDRNRHGGGVAIYSKPSLDVVPLAPVTTQKSQLESLWVTLSSSLLPSQIALCSCYLPPNPSSHSLHLLFSEVEVMLSRYRRVIICGDLNINLLTSSSLSSKFNNVISVLNLKQVISVPTRVTSTSNSLIDVCIVDADSPVVSSGSLMFGVSDHLICYTTFKWKPAPNKIPASSGKYRSFKNFCATDFIDDLRHVPWSVLDIFDDPSDKVDCYNLLLNDVLSCHAPLVKRKTSKKLAPWITRDLRKKMTYRNRLHRKFLRSKSSSDFETYRLFRNHVTLLQRKCKQAYFIDLINNKSPTSSL